MYEFRKIRRATKCTCGQPMVRGTHLISFEKQIVCLNCGVKRLNRDKEYYQNRISEINRSLRKVRRHPKEMVIAKLNPTN